jgi:hypothetical protein
MRTIKLILGALLCAAAANAAAGSKNLTVAFFDYSDNGLGKASFKSVRTNHFEHACWQKFVEIEGIETAYIENPPKSLGRELLLNAIHGSPSAAEQFAGALKAEGLFGAYAFVLDATGKYATIYGINYQDGAISASASFRKPANGTVSNATFSKALCEASASMD